MPGGNRTIARRRFVQLMGWAGAAAVAHGGPALAASTRRAKPPSRPPAAAPEDAKITDEARALAEVMERRYGQHLAPGDLETITRDLDGDVQVGRKLREVRLGNHEEPDTRFNA